MARPKKETELTRDRRVTIRLSETELAVIAGYASRAGMSVSEYIRTQTLKGKVNIEYSIVAAIPELQKLTNEFAAIGNNLNQIARYFNMGGIRSRAMQEEINACIAKLMEASQAVVQLAGGKYGNLKTRRSKK